MAHILVVDDHEDSRELLATLFRDRGHEVTVASGGAVALETAKASPPDLVISDVLMPGMDGFAFCQAWMADRTLNRCPFLFYSANYTDEADRRLARSLGADAYLTKPLPPEDLFYEVEGRLDGRIATRQTREPIEDDEFHARHNSVVTQKLEQKISQLEALNQAYEISQLGYLKLFAANPHCMWIYDRDSLRFLAVNNATIKAYGYTATEFLQMRITDIRPAEDVPKLVEYLAKEPQSPLKQTHWTHVKKDGTRIIAEVSTHSMDFEGRRATVVTALDISERVATAHRERELLEKTRDAMLGTIRVLSKIVELRDPRTAGHQQGVARLAVAIGEELGLPTDRIEGLKIAATIHDVGNISIPSNVLSKPGRLSEAEYDLVKGHVTASHELLRDVPFPWPVADIVWQHHERMDGSGYPRGLKGEELLLEARILAVADTVEAMSSRRPHRPPFEIAATLEEIASNAGRLYDPKVAAACLRLLRDKGFSLTTP